MRIENLENMIKGWFVGNFTPTAYRTNDVEVAIKEYQAGVKEEWHYHKIATEITVILSGCVRMNKQEFGTGSIIVLDPDEGSDFETLEDTVTVVVKIPGANNDKYLKGE